MDPLLSIEAGPRTATRQSRRARYTVASEQFGGVFVATSMGRRLLRVQDDVDLGQVTLPADLREKLGLKRGDLVTAVETADGLLLTSRRSAIDHELSAVDSELQKQGLSLDELIESGREIRGELLKDLYGING